MPRLWFTADSHFGHANIILYEGRPDNHEDLILSNLAAKVSSEDVLVHLGDFGFGSLEKLMTWWNRMPQCYRVLIMGNHDHRCKVKRLPWSLVEKKEYMVEYEGVTLLARHHPFTPDYAYRADILLHGHSHSKGPQQKWFGSTLVVNLSVEQWAYQPVSAEQLIEIWRSGPKNLAE